MKKVLLSIAFAFLVSISASSAVVFARDGSRDSTETETEQTTTEANSSTTETKDKAAEKIAENKKK